MNKHNTPMVQAAGPQMLRAGPISMKFADGELRYLTVGGREIIRRVYFAVRDKDFDTPAPQFSLVDVQASADAFTIRLAATCRNDFSHYDWSGTIQGAADGRITFMVAGQAMRDFPSPRVGLNVLYGVAATAGQTFERVLLEGDVVADEFPRDVAPERWDYGRWFHTLRYRTHGGSLVTARLHGGYAGIEDQRNFGDSSYKVYCYLPYAYPAVAAGQKQAQTLTIELAGEARDPVAEAPAVSTAPTSVRLGKPVDGAKMPAIVAPSHRARGFDSINKPEFHQARQLCWQFNPAAHLCDDDTLTENLPALGDQVRTTRRWAPQAHICIDPVGFDSRHPRPHRDARNHSAFGAAWCAAAAKYLALGGVDEAAFTVGPGPAEAVQAELARLAGRQVRAAEIAGGIPAAVEALAIQDDGATLLWLANLTAQEQQVTLENLPPLRRLTFKSLGANGRARNLAPQTACDRGTAALSLAPHEVLQVHFAS